MAIAGLQKKGVPDLLIAGLQEVDQARKSKSSRPEKVNPPLLSLLAKAFVLSR